MSEGARAEDQRRGRAMLFAAGFGRRMQALGREMPKPLVPVRGRPLIDRALARLMAAQQVPVVVNCHHKADRLQTHLAERIRAGQVILSDERARLMDTGGGVVQALPLLSEGPVTLVNGDALWRERPGAAPALAALKAAFDPMVMDVLLLLVPRTAAIGHDGAGDFFAPHGLDPAVARPLTPRGSAAEAPYVFTGLQRVDTALYRGRPRDPWSNRLLFEAAAQAGRLYGLCLDGDWMHVGTPDALAAAEAALATDDPADRADAMGAA
ncbi:nucleotidyltransferase family protein [Yunchengibacter salinarum]|uniref:nucleotidyltransferase family protein n=1 Tax=Yunchengibacter salinarum TaxID=3133399 RepID=UPI0035B66D98